MKRTGHMGMSEEARSQRMKSIGGSDARIIMSGDQDAIERLWMEKRGEIESQDFSDVLVVQMGVVLEDLNLDWFEKKTGFEVRSEQKRCQYEHWDVATCTLDGEVFEKEESIGMFEAKFMLPFYWTMDGAVEKYYAQLQHNMMVTQSDKIWISVITGAAGFSYLEIEADMFYQAKMLETEQMFWDCVQNGTTPGNPAPPPVAFVMPDLVVDMTGSNEFAQAAADFLESKDGVKKHEKSKKDLKNLMPTDAKEAKGYGVKLSRSKNGTVTIKPEKGEASE